MRKMGFVRHRGKRSSDWGLISDADLGYNLYACGDSVMQ